MIEGIGTDIIEIDRIKKAIKKNPRFASEVLSKKEIEYCSRFKDPSPHVAARFAAKEALFKALPKVTPAIEWQEVEIINDKNGKPEVFFSNRVKKALGSYRALLSISHSKEFAIATAIFVKE